jgi:serine/threonine protein kinase
VTHEKTGDPAVAKIPHSKDMNRRFMHEAAILKRFKGHPHAVQMKEIVQEEGRAVLIQEYVEGKTLLEMLDESMESAEKEVTFLQLLDVTAYGHDLNIMHRDIKPENIIVQGSGSIKLLDFGTGKDLVKKHMSGTIIGTRPYMSPEQINGESCLASDVWALGVVLYALSTGYLPFFDQNEKQLMDQILECNPENPRSLEPRMCEALEHIILRCLEKKPENRYLNARQLLDDVRKTFPDFGNGGVIPD